MPPVSAAPANWPTVRKRTTKAKLSTPSERISRMVASALSARPTTSRPSVEKNPRLKVDSRRFGCECLAGVRSMAAQSSGGTS
jgi:hypothetical protein